MTISEIDQMCVKYFILYRGFIEQKIRFHFTKDYWDSRVTKSQLFGQKARLKQQEYFN